MGYTHYWRQLRNFSADAWHTTAEDIGAILKHAQHVAGVPLADHTGAGGTSPLLGADCIAFDGVGDDSCESFVIDRRIPALEPWQTRDRRGRGFCKTARNPYDLPVTAALCYLSSIAETHHVTSDGTGANFLEGLELARAALPRYANRLDLPLGVMEDDRWCGPRPWVRTDAYQVRFCVDGRGYVIRNATRESYRFADHVELAKFLARTRRATFSTELRIEWGGRVETISGRVEPDIWEATGTFDDKRTRRIGIAQARALAQLFPATGEAATPPPAFVRPGTMPEPAEPLARTIAELIRAAA